MATYLNIRAGRARKITKKPIIVSELGSNSTPGDKATWGAVMDDVQTLPMLSPRKLVVVEQADPFVTEHRPALEAYAQKPSKGGVLVLDVKSFPETTKLATSHWTVGPLAGRSAFTGRSAATMPDSQSNVATSRRSLLPRSTLSSQGCRPAGVMS